MLLIFLDWALAKGRADRLDTECRTGFCNHCIQSSNLRIRRENTGNYNNMGIDKGTEMDTDSNREIGIGIEGILGMSDIPDIASCLLVGL